MGREPAKVARQASARRLTGPRRMAGAYERSGVRFKKNPPAQFPERG
jgi:hypothetical protein